MPAEQPRGIKVRLRFHAIHFLKFSILTEITMVLRDVKAHFQVQVGLLEEEVELLPS